MNLNMYIEGGVLETESVYYMEDCTVFKKLTFAKKPYMNGSKKNIMNTPVDIYPIISDNNFYITKFM